MPPTLPPSDDAVVTLNAGVLYTLVYLAQQEYERLRDQAKVAPDDEDLTERAEDALGSILIALFKLHDLEPAQ